MTKTTKKILYLLGSLVILLQAVVEIAAVYEMIQSNMIPNVILIVGIAILVILQAVTTVLFFVKPKKKNDKKTGDKISQKKRLKKHRRIAMILAVIMILICGLLTYVMAKVNDAFGAITNEDGQYIEIGVYVMKDSPAQSINDLTDSTFGMTDSYDAENTQAALNDINDKLGKEVATENYDSVNTMVDALYSGQTDAMILNEAYASILEDQEAYQNFSDDTRIVYTYRIKVDEDEKRDVKVTKDPFVVYISGSDTRSDKLATSRSDVNLLAVVNPETKQVLLLNTPRDYYVQTSVSGGAKDKLTHAGIYGVQCSMDTLSMLYDTPVDYYMQINFTGFETMIDAIDGVDVDVDQAVTTDDGYSFSEGINTMNGKEALSYVRERHHFADGDNARGRHQMAVISAIIQKASSGTTILKHYGDIMDSMEGMFVMDMSQDNLGNLVKMQLSDGSSWNVKSYAVTGENSSNYTYSAPGQQLYVMEPDQDTVDHAKELINKVFSGETLTDEDVAAQ